MTRPARATGTGATFQGSTTTSCRAQGEAR